MRDPIVIHSNTRPDAVLQALRQVGQVSGKRFRLTNGSKLVTLAGTVTSTRDGGSVIRASISPRWPVAWPLGVGAAALLLLFDRLTGILALAVVVALTIVVRSRASRSAGRKGANDALEALSVQR